MEKTWEAAHLLTNGPKLSDLPEELVVPLRSGTSSQYLDAISTLALNPSFTSVIVATHEDILIEICSRWISNVGSLSEVTRVLSILAKILPLAPYLSSYVIMLLDRHSTAISQLFGIHRATESSNGSDRPLHHDLLMVYRLLTFNNRDFARMVSPSHMQLLMNHYHRPTRYLAIRILCLYLHTSDESTNKMIKDYVGEENAIEGTWETRNIDYFFLTLWEEKRVNSLRKDMDEARASRYSTTHLSKAVHVLTRPDLSPYTAIFGHVLLPRLEGVPSSPSSLIVTPSVEQNMSSLAKAVRNSDNVLITGPSGAGKSALIRDLARELCKSSSAITIHLNEQTDIKLLIGLYTSDKTPGSFNWHAGILTQAVLEGRWVIIEDIDRAPAEVISTLLPLLERGELFVQGQNEVITAAPGFKLIATIRSFVKPQGGIVIPGHAGIGSRHWTKVSVPAPEDTERAGIISHRYPTLHAYIPSIMRVYGSLQGQSHFRATAREVAHDTSLYHGFRELLRWCRRLNLLLRAAGIESGTEAISESTNDSIFLEAVDCFAGALPSGSTKAATVALISKELHIPAERAIYCLEARKPELLHNSKILKVGRAYLNSGTTTKNSKALDETRPFAMTDEVLRILESVGRATQMAEPCLLVGETGTGKTALVQHLAGLTHTKLHVVNLSQQSEAGDLLGGYKPVSLRSLAAPMLDSFEQLFRLTFSKKRNERYIDSIAKAIEKGRWPRVVAFWQEALQMVQSTFRPDSHINEDGEQEPRPKKRRMEQPKYQTLKARWDEFESTLRVFQMHLASGSKGFAFSFVEGTIVKAVRNGEWVLLDEINLASPDTLESIADLLVDTADGGPSLLLSESGRTERVTAHKNFRIFGAMNPATDIGKRDLPVGLRSRFTEIYVDSPDRKFENLILVIKEYLGNHTHIDRRAAADIANLYLEVKHLAEQNAIVDGSNQKPHFSLRTLTRTLVYVTDIAPIYGLRRSIYEGFAMSFLTLLNADSGLKVLSLIEKYVIGSQTNGRAVLKQIPRPPEDNEKFIQFRHYWVFRGDHPILDQSHYILTPFVERNLLNLVRATSTRRFPVLLQGPTSSGKTSMIEYLANVSGNKFLRINNHEHTDIQEYLGTYISGPDGSLQYQEGILVRALREGSWIVLDELNLAPSDVLEALNRLLDDNKELRLPETQEIIRPHANFMLFATQNPPGMYGGRKILSRAFRNRFLELHFDDLPEEDLETILRERCRIAPSFCTRIVAVYRRLSLIRQRGRLFEQKNSFATLRDLFRWASRDADDREQLAINGFMLLAERVRDADERLVVKQVIEDIMKVTIDERQIYNVSRVPRTSRCATGIGVSIVWTESMLRLYSLVTAALKNNEPVLLVGETGSGKTTICQLVAEQMGKYLHAINAHQNMETSDLIGSQRPVRNRATTESHLARRLGQLLKIPQSHESIFEDLPTLLAAYDSLEPHKVAKFSPETHLSIKTERSKLGALFEWADGSLVQAMRAGQHFLLDEISLADDSVLERMNSVLEPGRTLLLAENGISTAPIAASTGFQVYATMNPGGDYGKKELSPALRNRFTEIWVPLVLDRQEMLVIAHAKLATKYTDLGAPMIAFAAWYSHRYNPITPSISIRDLLSWVDFINRFGSLNTNFAVVQGAAMVFIDGLGADPAAKTWIPNDLLHEERQSCLSQLGELFNCDMAEIYLREPLLTMNAETLTVGSFHMDVRQKVPQDPSYLLDAPTTKTNVLKIVRAMQVQKPILLEGSPGVGKTTLVSAIARTIGMPLTRINLSDQTDLTDLFGSDVPLEGSEAGRFGWHEAPFLTAMQNGEWVLLDEMNLASQSVLEGLNACLDHRGQVYIPELDQTFSRHDNFVVFAAQNPRHEGGGRKGLPASFVNRFTVVYVDKFTHNDLLMICSQAFKTCSRQLIEKVTQCITAVSSFLQDRAGVCLQGGPWEFNLRDAFRWLQLLTSRDGFMSAGTAADYLDVIFLQRLRTPEDRHNLLVILGQFFPNERKSPRHSLILSETHLQVGLGIVARNRELSGIHAEGSWTRELNLSITESIIFCLQQSWPCLLVGPSGSGKTRTINQLGRIVRAEIVTISLNAETDTIDLLGGYEQTNPQRLITTAIKKFTILTRKVIAESVLTGTPHAYLIEMLEKQIRQPMPDPLQLVVSIREIAREFPAIDFGSVADEIEEAIQHKRSNTKARFEWVDGVLVNALNDGAWLVLDNANLCSPSILDRLNSLLEPNGYLTINEHCASDGTARVVKPHPSFRLFLTADPRHGELSRAMRNRSVELFLSSMPGDRHPDLMPESAISRFATFAQFDWESLQDNHSLELSSVCFEHLSFSDIHLISRWNEQVERGLINIASNRRSQFLFAFKAFDSMLHEHQALFQETKSEFRHALPGMEAGTSLLQFSEALTLHPLNNSVLVRLTAECDFASDFRWRGFLFSFLVSYYYFHALVQGLKENSTSKIASRMSQLELSFAPRWMNHGYTVFPIGNFLERIDQLLCQALTQWKLNKCDYVWLETMEKILLYAEDLSDFAGISPFDQSAFQVYQIIGSSIMESASDHPKHRELLSSFSSAIGIFSETMQLKSGLSMELLWSLFREKSPYDSSLQDWHETEKLSDSFDSLPWPNEAPLKVLNALRRSIVGIFESLVYSNSKGPGTLKDIRAAVEGIHSASNEASKLQVGPKFRHSFEALYQYSQMTPTGYAQTISPSDPMLSLLSCQPTKTMIDNPTATYSCQIIKSIERCTGIAKAENILTPFRDTFGLSVLQDLTSIPEIPLRSFELVCSELSILAHRTASMTSSLSTQHIQTLTTMLRQLHSHVMDVHEEVLEPKSLARYRAYIEAQASTSSDDNFQSVPLVDVKSGLHKSTFLSSVLRDHLNPSILMQHNVSACRASGQKFEDTFSTAAAFIHFFTGCLILYVPDHEFDPASRPLVERDRHSKRRNRLESKLWALKTFEQINIGEQTSLRSQIVQSQLETLGDEPPVRLVARPQQPTLGELQVVLNGILESVVRNAPNKADLQRFLQGDMLLKSNIERLRSYIMRFTARLENGLHLYEDITRPLVSFLHGLGVGLELALIAYDKKNSVDENLRSVCCLTPFLGMEPGLLSIRTFGNLHSHAAHTDLRLLFLRLVVAAPAVYYTQNTLMRETMFEVFHSYYMEWKEQLSKDQKENATKSSLYRYRSSKQDDDDDEQEVRQLFHMDENQTTENKSSSLVSNPRILAQSLAATQRELFGDKKKAPQRLMNVIEEAAKRLGRTQKGALSCPVPAERFIPTLIVMLHRNCEKIQTSGVVMDRYDFYTDLNVPEVKRLLRILYLIQVRYTVIQETWPEHVTIQDVLAVSKQLLGMSHTDPIAKLLTKTEQLHGFMYEWQRVASKEFSAVDLYEQLTGLLISWRRLELSTWARLLDKEDARCAEDVEAWWFVAYEAIIAVPLSLTDSGESIGLHAENLLATLSDFLMTTSVGHYNHRLRLIDAFKSFVHLLSCDLPIMKAIENALQNFLNFYKRFDRHIQDSLRKGRQTIEKDLKEILVLASWKDTNINALRESAKRSHHKLFKVVRKYRTILAQPAQQSIYQVLPKLDGIKLPSAHLRSESKVPDVTAALQLCQENLSLWSSRSTRFTDPIATANKMKSMGKIPPLATNVGDELRNDALDLLENIEILQKETPATRTKDNLSLIKHLKSRKRKLFVDTLNNIRQMGFQSNVSSNILADQSSVAKVLASTPAFKEAELNSDLASADFHLHTTLDLLTQIREKPATSNDISSSERARSLGCLESMLSTVLRERATLAPHYENLHHLDVVLNVWEHLSSSDFVPLKCDDMHTDSLMSDISTQLAWLSPLLKTAYILVEKHGQLGEADNSIIMERLAIWEDRITKLADLRTTLPELPKGVTSSAHQQLCNQFKASLEELSTNLRDWAQEFPPLGFVLRQLEPWTVVAIVNSQEDKNGAKSIDLMDFDKDMSKALDSILVAVQRMNDSFKTIPTSDKERGWLIQILKSCSNSLRSLQVGEMTCILQNPMQNFPHLVCSQVLGLEVASATCAMALPIIQQYRNIVKDTLDTSATTHRELCSFVATQAKSYLQIVEHGFCEPSDSSASDTGEAGKLEEGTGLGEGEGAEDVSKDVQDDEDLSELAQNGKEKEKDSTEGVDDAVDMNNDEMEGELNDASGSEVEDDGKSGEEQTNVDEERGDVDDLDPEAVDEKLWDGRADEPRSEKEGENDTGKTQKDEHMAGEGKQSEDGVDSDAEMSVNEEAGEDEEVVSGEKQKLDPFLKEEENLDLPEEMDLDNDGRSVMSDLQGSDLDEEEDVGNEADDQRKATESPGSDDGHDHENFPDNTSELPKSQDDDNNSNADKTGDTSVGSPVDTEPEDELSDEDPNLVPNHGDDQVVNSENVANSDALGQTQDADEHENTEQSGENNARDEEHGQAQNPDQGDARATADRKGEESGPMVAENTSSSNKPILEDNTTSQAFKKLGDALEKWHRQDREIRNAPEEAPPKHTGAAVEDKDFEHLQDEDAQADAQALGAATEEQVQALNQQAQDTEMKDQSNGYLSDEQDQDMLNDVDETTKDEEPMPPSLLERQQSSKPSAFIGKSDRQQTDNSTPTNTGEGNDNDSLESENTPSSQHTPNTALTTLSHAEARQLWSHYESLTNPLSLVLTEQLRLILTPTQATKMRGDFRTGKRLNIKRIIPYIASNYKRDKIWMRRSVPQKRNYQIMLAVDDSKSMGESGSGQLAFEALVLVTKSLSMLEVGEIAVVGFGEHVKVAHEFDKPFSAEAGANIIQQFGFKQTKTNVRKLVAESIELFRDARAKSVSSSATELWQLQLIISDGICEDHDTIRRLVRQAQEERIMIVFVIVDAIRGESIVDMSQAVFEPDPDIEGGQKLKIKRYLDGFPFMYYLVVGDVKELPGVLATALRGWFSEVVGEGG